MDEKECKECGRKFKWGIVGTIYPGGKEREDIDCPYCGANNGSVMTSAFVKTEKVES